jgi:transketolase
VVVEAGISQGWHAITRSDMLFITMDRFGESAPAEELAEKFGFTGKAVAEKMVAWLGKA